MLICKTKTSHLSKMLGSIAELLTTIALIMACVQTIWPVLWGETKVLRLVGLVILLLISTSFLMLILSFVLSDFSLILVANNSHISKPLIYKIAAAWGNHEGSMLMWVLILAIFNVAIASSGRDMVSEKHMRAMLSCHGFIIALFTSYVLYLSNPFMRIFPVPETGLGLNPMLQDIGLALHPPTLYMGYVGFSVTYASGVAAILCETQVRQWAKQCLPYILAAWTFLTAGIGLGGWWAYRELGWGGYWFWDPVENASLIPWLSATALIHALSCVVRHGKMHGWALLLSVLTFSLSGVGTFLVRSGAVSSVHSFTSDPYRGVAILVIASALLIFGVVVFIYKYREKEKIDIINVSSKDHAFLLVVQNIVMIFFASVVLTGTLYPIVYEMITKEHISVGPEYYNYFLKHVVIILLVAAIFVPRLNLRASVYGLIVGCIISYHLEVKEYYTWVILALGIASMLSLLQNLGTIRRAAQIPLIIGHLGFGLLIVSIGLNAATSSEVHGVLFKGGRLEIGGYGVQLNDASYTAGPNYASKVASFVVWDGRKMLGAVSPEIRFYPAENKVIAESDTLHTLASDVMITVMQEKDSDLFGVSVQVRPGMFLIWASAFLLVCSGVLATIRRWCEWRGVK